MVYRIAQQLPGDLEWMVMFRIATIKRFADRDTIIRMYFLNSETDVDSYDFVVLTSAGRFLYRHSDESFTHGETLEPQKFEKGGLYESYADRLRYFDLDAADSLATGFYPEYGKVVLYIRFGENVAYAESVFNRAPSLWLYEALQAVGIRYISGEPVDGLFFARYENTLSKHIASGVLANFSRTDNCNLFFFLHGNINGELAQGLVQAGTKRLQYEQQIIGAMLKEIAERSLREKLQMKMMVPYNSEEAGFGDVVPKGFLYGALRDRFKDDSFVSDYWAALEKDKLRGLWTFEKEDLETSIDSALVLFNSYDREAAQLINKFCDPKTGAYLPQVAHEDPAEGQMKYVMEKDHWCRDDIATSALIYRILKDHNVETDPRLEGYVLENFTRRSDLYIANPFLVDWLYALGLGASEKSALQKNMLREEILSAVNSDYSVGRYDKVFSTACAFLSLYELGCDDNLLFAFQLYVLNHYRNQKEMRPIPFYSSLIVQEGAALPDRYCRVNGKLLSVFLYQDVYSMIYTAIVSRCLNVSLTPAVDHPGISNYLDKPCPPRYAAEDHLGYISEYSLPNYL